MVPMGQSGGDDVVVDAGNQHMGKFKALDAMHGGHTHAFGAAVRGVALEIEIGARAWAKAGCRPQLVVGWCAPRDRRGLRSSARPGARLRGF